MNKRFDHLNYNSLALMKKMHMVDDLPHIKADKDIYEGYPLGKQHREIFLNYSYREKGPLHLIYTDLYGPMDVPLLESVKDFFIFINDYTKKTWVYFLKFKLDVFNCFVNFKTL